MWLWFSHLASSLLFTTLVQPSLLHLRCFYGSLENGRGILIWLTFQPPKKLLKTTSGKRLNPPVTDVDIAIISKRCATKSTVKNNTGDL